MKPYEIIEHTADVGLRIYGKDLKELFAHAAIGLGDLMTDISKVSIKEEQRIQLKGEDVGDLLLKWLREILFLFSAQHKIFKEVTFHQLTEKELDATVKGEIFNPAIHDQKCEVKAVTYHQFKLERQKTGTWIAEVIFDI